jgi:hypothetical protein
VHQKVSKVKRILDKLDFSQEDRLISLGDWMDDFGDTPEIAENTANYILELQKTLGDRFLWLLGNHDIPYVFPETSTWHWCSGVSRAKVDAVVKVFGGKLDFSNIDLVHIVERDGYLPLSLSHAGVHRGQFAKSLKKISPEAVIKKTTRALKNSKAGKYDEFLSAGRCRGGRSPVGGITWLDWWNEFEPVSGLNQVVGHTTQEYEPYVVDGKFELIYPTFQTTEHGLRAVQYEFAKNSQFNICLDTHLNHCLVLSEKLITIIELYEV